MPKRKSRSPASPPKSKPRATVTPQQFSDRLHTLCLALLTALFVATPLVPSEAVANEGTGAVLVTLWMVSLLIWAVGCAARPGFPLRFGRTEIAVVVLVAIHSLSAIVVVATDSGNGRAALNMLWQWVSFGAGYFLVRQLARTSRQCRALCVVMIGLAVSLSVIGYVQYFYERPRDLATFENANEEEKQELLRQANLTEARAGTALRRHFEDRLRATEPLGTFTLTNSLAGFLCPWFVLALAIAVTIWKQPELRKRLLAVIVCLLVLVLMLGCLVLTKSRTAWLATIGGVGLLLMYGRSRGWKLHWQVPAIAAAVLVALGLGVFAAGGVDREVVSEAPKSVLYRFEYWQATSAVIADQPWLGCGPGNFGDAYAEHKLPQASEEVKDPHNVLLEVWATAGTLAVLALLAVFVCFALQMRRAMRTNADDDGPSKATPQQGSYLPLYAGALFGIVLAYPCALAVGFALRNSVFFIGLPVLASCLALLHPWTEQGRLPVSASVIAMIVLLVNLLAAGAAGFPGVSQSWWILLAVSLNLGEERSPPRTFKRPLALSLCGGALVLVVACYVTVFNPVVAGRRLVAEGDASFEQAFSGQSSEPRKQFFAAEEHFRQATVADPYWAAPWERLASIYHTYWQLSRQDRYFEQFEQAAEEALLRNPRSYRTRRYLAGLYAVAFQREGQHRHIEAAIALQRTAVDNYPNNAMAHAQLAWMHSLAGDEESAKQEAEEALRLDALNPHTEQKLQNRTFDGESLPTDTKNTEQLMLQLRSGELPTETPD